MLSYAQCLSQSPQQKRKFLTSPWTVTSFLYMNSVTQAAHTGLSEKLFISYCSKGSCRSVSPELHCGLSCQSDPPQSEWIIFLAQDWDATEATTRLWWRSQCVGGKSQIKGGWRKRDWVAWKNKKNFIVELWLGGEGAFTACAWLAQAHKHYCDEHRAVNNEWWPCPSTHLKMPITHVEQLFILP